MSAAPREALHTFDSAFMTFLTLGHCNANHVNLDNLLPYAAMLLRRITIAFTFLLVLVLRASGAIASPDIGNPAPALHLLNMYKQPFFPDVAGASAIGWFMGMIKGFSGSREWFAKYGYATPPRPLTIFFDLIMFVGAGAILGTGLFDPDKLVSALSAGLSWPLAFGGLTTGPSEPQAGATPRQPLAAGAGV